MTTHGKLNLLGMLLPPLAAAVGALIMFGPLPATLATVFAINAIPMLIAGLVTGLLLRRAGRLGGRGRAVALWPTLIPAVIFTVWYLWRGFVPQQVAPGAEMITGPQYLLIAVIVLGVVAWVASRLQQTR